MFGDMQSGVCGEAAACSPRSEAEGRSIPEEDDRTPPPPRRKSPSLRLRLNGQKRTSVPKGPQRAYFPSDGLGKSLPTPPYRTEWYVEADLRSGSAPQRDGAAPRRSVCRLRSVDGRGGARAAQQPRLQPPRLQLLENLRQGCRGGDPGAAGAVVVGVVEEEDVPGADAGGHAIRDRVRPRPPVPVPPPLRPQHRA